MRKDSALVNHKKSSEDYTIENSFDFLLSLLSLFRLLLANY